MMWVCFPSATCTPSPAWSARWATTALGSQPLIFCAMRSLNKLASATTWMAKRSFTALSPAHFSMVNHFLLHSEYELNKGCADFVPGAIRRPISRHAVRLRAGTEVSQAGASLSTSPCWRRRWGRPRSKYAAILADPGLQRRYPSVQHIGLAVVFHGWEMVAYEAVDRRCAMTGAILSWHCAVSGNDRHFPDT